MVRAFALVQNESDWEQPRGNAEKEWRSNGRCALADQYDVGALDAENLALPAAAEELRTRMMPDVLYEKYLAKLSR